MLVLLKNMHYKIVIMYLDKNECLEESVCPGDSQCINTDGSYTCSCEKGYHYVNNENMNMCIGKTAKTNQHYSLDALD